MTGKDLLQLHLKDGNGDYFRHFIANREARRIPMMYNIVQDLFGSKVKSTAKEIVCIYRIDTRTGRRV